MTLPLRPALILFLAWSALGGQFISAQENEAPAEMSSRAAGSTLDPRSILEELQADVLRVLIYARLRNSDDVILWQMDLDELTVPGRGVKIRLNGEQVVVEVEFIPYIQEDARILIVAQGQTWAHSEAEDKLRYQTSLKGIPVDAGEPVVFYPLGFDPENGVNLELEVMVNRYEPGSGQESGAEQEESEETEDSNSPPPGGGNPESEDQQDDSAGQSAGNSESR